MNREEAIEYWEGLRKTFSSQLEKEENHFGRMHLQTTIDALDMAIAALRQQETVTDSHQLNDTLKEFAEDVACQFAYHIKTADGHAAYSTGGLSTLETAFEILGWDEPHPCPECECQADGCHEWATCGTPTKDGYKWLCGKHFKAFSRKQTMPDLKPCYGKCESCVWKYNGDCSEWNGWIRSGEEEA